MLTEEPSILPYKCTKTSNKTGDQFHPRWRDLRTSTLIALGFTVFSYLKILDLRILEAESAPQIAMNRVNIHFPR